MCIIKNSINIYAVEWNVTIEKKQKAAAAKRNEKERSSLFQSREKCGMGRSMQPQNNTVEKKLYQLRKYIKCV
jgi:hypothetical protein